MENKDFVHIKNVLNKALESFRRESDLDLVKIWDLWDRAVGKAVSENTRPAAFKGRLLLVYVSSSTWLHELSFLKADILKKVNLALGENLVEEIKFKVGPV